MIFRYIYAALALSAPAAAETSINCEDAAAYHQFAMLGVSVMQGLAGDCADDFSQPACKTFIAKVAKSEKADGARADAFIKFMQAQCGDAIKTELPR